MNALNDPHFQDAAKAREWLESLLWPNGPVCPHCGTVSKDHYTLKGKGGKKGAAHRPGLWMCRDCREQFTVTVGTVFERSKIALNVWLQAVYLICSSKKGISSHQLHRTLGVTYKTAWFMAHRIREAMRTTGGGFLGGGGKIVEADETYYGREPGRPLASRYGGKHGGGSHKNVLKGSGDLSYICGNCKAVLLQNVDFAQVQNIVVKCGGCGSHNQIPTTHHTH